jgi:hypothetical protein
MVVMNLHIFRNIFGFSGKLELSVSDLIRRNMAGEWLVFLLHTQEVPRSNLGLKTAVLTHVSRCSQLLQASAVILSKVNAPSLPSTSCPIYDSLSNILFDAMQPEMLRLYS